MRLSKHKTACRPLLSSTLLLGSGFAILLGSIQPALSQAAQPHHHHPHAETIHLQPLVITAVQQDSPLTVVTDPGEARQPIPASDGTDYLKTIPGFSAIRNGGSNGDPVLRGMFGSRLNLRTNGGLMPGACPARMDAPSSYIAPETFDQLTVIKGPQTVLWGPGASAGTVLFERGPEQFDEPGMRLDANLMGGSNGRIDTTLDAAVGSSQGYLRLTGNQSRSDDYDDGDDRRVPSRWDKWSSDATLGWTPTADTRIEFSAGRGDGEARYGGRGMDGSKFERESLGLRFEQSNIGGLLDKIEAQIHYNAADHVMDNFRLRSPDPASMMPMPMASQVDRRTLSGRVAATWKGADLDWVTGIDGSRSEHRSRSSSYDKATATYTDADAFRRTRDAVERGYGAFAELTWRMTDQRRIIAGARLDRVSTRDDRQTTGRMGMRLPNPTAGDTRTDTLPSGFARLEYDLADSPATLYAGIGHVQRFPDYWELFSPHSGPAGTRNAFSGIDPEKTTQLDFGIQYEGETLQAWASAYIGQVRDFILFEYHAGHMGMSSSQADNIDARIMGGEAGLARQWGSGWKTDATLAYAWGKNSSDDEALPQIPPLELKLGLSYETGTWSAGALWRAVAAQNRIAAGKGNVVGRDFDGSGGFGVFSINGSYRFSPRLKLSAGIDNLLDKAYSEHLNLAGDAGFGYPADTAIREPGRMLWGKLDFSF